MTKHSFLAKCQVNFLKSKKELLLPNMAIVLSDFAENYKLVIKDVIQSYQWSKKFYTIHPLVFYLFDDDGQLKHESFCLILDENINETNKIQTILVNT